MHVTGVRGRFARFTKLILTAALLGGTFATASLALDQTVASAASIACSTPPTAGASVTWDAGIPQSYSVVCYSSKGDPSSIVVSSGSLPADAVMGTTTTSSPACTTGYSSPDYTLTCPITDTPAVSEVGDYSATFEVTEGTSTATSGALKIDVVNTPPYWNPTFVGQLDSGGNQPSWCQGISVVGGGDMLPLTAMSGTTLPSGVTLNDVNLTDGTAELCGKDTGAVGTNELADVKATNAYGSSTQDVEIGVYGGCSWTATGATTTAWDNDQDIDVTGQPAAYGDPITDGASPDGTTDEYATCDDVYMPNSSYGTEGGFTQLQSNPVPDPTDSNPAANQGDLSESNLDASDCYITEVSDGALYSGGSTASQAMPAGSSASGSSDPWTNGGECIVEPAGIVAIQAGGNTDTYGQDPGDAACPPSQQDVNAGFETCSAVLAAGNDYMGATGPTYEAGAQGNLTFSSNQAFYNGQATPDLPTAGFNSSSVPSGSSSQVDITSSSDWWGATDGAPNGGASDIPGSDNYYATYQPTVWIAPSSDPLSDIENGNQGATELTSSVDVSAASYTCTGAESGTVGPNPCTLASPAIEGGSDFTVPSSLAAGSYNVFIEEDDTTPYPGNGPLPTDGVSGPAATTGTVMSETPLTVSGGVEAPTFTSADATTFTTGQSGNFSVTATGATSYTESGALPNGVTFVDNGNGTATLSGTPAAGTGGTYTITIDATNSGGTTPQTFTLTVDQAPAITSGDSATFTTGTDGSFTVDATGYPTAALSESGALPNGVTFVDNGNGTATLSGTPAAGTGGTYPITITAGNGVGTDATQSFTLTVDQAPAITSGDSAIFTTGTDGSFTVTSTGYPTAALSESGSLPSGVSFVDNGNGTATLSGTPAAGTQGSYPLTITAGNGVGTAATQSFTLTVNEAQSSPTFTSADSTTFTTGTDGSFTVTTTGNPTPSLSESGPLPPGVNFVDNGNGTGTLSGTPDAGTSGSYTVTLLASNSAGTTPQTFTLTVDQAPAITSGDSATFTTGTDGSFTVDATGYPTAALSESGALPNGVTFVDNGNGTATLSGTPAAGTGGTYPITITAGNGVGTDATQSFTLTVDQAPAITSGDSATFTTGTDGSFTVDATGYPTASISESGSLPNGVTFVDNGNGTATLAGTPAAGTAGSYPITITATNGVGSPATQSFTLTVNTTETSPTITSGSSTTFTTGSSGSFTVTTTGNPTPSLTESGTLPSGVSFVDNGDGTATLSGTPTASAGGTYDFTITAANGVGSPAAQSFTLTVDQAPAITSGDATSFGLGEAGSFTVTSTGYPTAALSESGSLPSGVTFTDDGNGTATLSGTPAAGTAGSYPITITAANGVGSPATQSFTLSVVAIPTVTKVSPSSGSGGGDTKVTIDGTNLSGVTGVDFGSVAGTDVTLNANGKSLTAVSPAEAAGTVNVTLSANGATSPITSADQYTFLAPTVTAVSPASGPGGAGAKVTVEGEDLNGATQVLFGDSPATIVKSSATKVSVLAPQGTAGTVDVTVTTPGGTSAVTTADEYTYVLPAVTSVATKLDASNGPGGGGTKLVVSGTNLLGATQVLFGDTPATITSVKNTSIKVVSPPHAAGTVDVTVITPAGQSPTSSADQFTYDAPTVTAVSPTTGPGAGGNKVIITGTNLIGATQVLFGGVAGTITEVKATAVDVTAPAEAAGTVDITVTTPGGTSATSSADQYTYLAPTVTKLKPTSGSSGGGTTVTVTGTNLTGATQVLFGGVAGTNVTVTKSTSLTVDSPAESAGTVNVTVTTPGGTSATSSADDFTFTG